jgi:hypothetical protein
VLLCVEREVGEVRRLGVTVDPDDSALLVEAIVVADVLNRHGSRSSERPLPEVFQLLERDADQISNSTMDPPTSPMIA